VADDVIKGRADAGGVGGITIMQGGGDGPGLQVETMGEVIKFAGGDPFSGLGTGGLQDLGGKVSRVANSFDLLVAFDDDVVLLAVLIFDVTLAGRAAVGVVALFPFVATAAPAGVVATYHRRDSQFFSLG